MIDYLQFDGDLVRHKDLLERRVQSRSDSVDSFQNIHCFEPFESEYFRAGIGIIRITDREFGQERARVQRRVRDFRPLKRDFYIEGIACWH